MSNVRSRSHLVMGIIAMAALLLLLPSTPSGAARGEPPFQPEIDVSVPERTYTELPFEVRVTVSSGERPLPQGRVALDPMPGWTIEPGFHELERMSRGQSHTVTFQAIPPAVADPAASLVVSLDVQRWSWQESMDLELRPCVTTEPDPSLKVPESDFSRGLEWMGPVLHDPDWTLWGASPLIDDQGKVHLFVARWPETNVDPAWRRTSEIAHYVGDSPEGPFEFSDVALTGTGVAGDWDRYAAHNPEIQRFGDKYVLLYIANSDYRQPPHPLNQRTGMAVSDSPYGPWERVNPDSDQPGLLLAPDEGHFTEGRHLVNPTMTKIGDTYLIYYKTSTTERGTLFAVATSKNLTGPYTLRDEPLTPRGVTIEDATVFIEDGEVRFLTTDNHGDVTGVTGGGAMFYSTDGLTFDLDRTEVGYRPIPHYYDEYGQHPILRIYGGAPKFERPKVLTIDGKAAYMYAPSGWNVTGQTRTVVHLMRVTDPATSECPV